MAMNAVVYQVAIASPSDVKAERLFARQAIYEWNSAHSAKRAAILHPVGWEKDVSPLMGGTAQGHIDKQIIKESDFLIAIFWTRLGTPTGGAESGTVKEIKEFLDAEKPVAVYFNTQPARLSDTDRDQYDALQEFLRWCRGNGLISEYDGIEEFKDKLRLDLARHMNHHSYFQRQVPEGYKIEAHGVVGEEVPAKEPSFLSAEAQELLIAATKDRNGQIISMRTLSGGELATNDRNFLPTDSRGVAIWRGALEELESAGLIVAAGPKREVFTVTSEGYSLADRLAVAAEAENSRIFRSTHPRMAGLFDSLRGK